MDFFHALDTRKTIRKYDNYIPTKDEIKRIINSARLAPSALNAQNWEFIAVYNQEIKNSMAEAVNQFYDKTMLLLDKEIAVNVERYRGHSTFFAKAPVVIACVLKKTASFMSDVLENAGYSEKDIETMRPDSFLLSMGGAIENMALSATALGLGSCWMVAPILAHQGLKEALKLEDDDRLVTLLTIGKPFEENDHRSPRKKLDEIMKIIE